MSSVLSINASSTIAIGSMSTVKSPAKMEQIAGREEADRTLSGDYLVRGIRHLVAQGGYDMIMDLVKDSV